jgi:23S rRNA pseudouridine2605 synthase
MAVLNPSPRLNKFLADQGLGARREIDHWIGEGRLTRNGNTVQLGERYEEGDDLALDGEVLSLAHRKYASKTPLVLLYHKPMGEISSKKDPEGRASIFDNLPPLERSKGRWVQIGRLDFQTSGLILFTNDGQLANKLMHPSSQIEREYISKVRGQFNSQDKIWQEGANVGDPTPIRAAYYECLEQLDTSYWVRIVLLEGRYRAVRRFFEANEQTVVKLQRSRFGTITLGSELRMGESRLATVKELKSLLEACEKDKV